MTHQKFEGERTLMRIHIGESDKWHGKPLHEAIVEMLRKDNFSGATVLRGVAGFGSSSVYHTDKLLRMSQDLPIILEVIESQERIEQILPRLDEMVDGGLITLEKVGDFVSGGVTVETVSSGGLGPMRAKRQCRRSELQPPDKIKTFFSG